MTRRAPATPSIESPQNQAVRQARALERDRDERDRTGLYLAWGMHLAHEALQARADLERVFVSPAVDRGTEGRDLVHQLAATGAPLVRTTERVLESVAPGVADQGVLLVVRRPARDLALIVRGRPALLLLLHGVQDPGNVGSMARTALAFGADALLALEGCADPFSSRAARAAMGALFRLPVMSAPATEVLPALRAAGIALVAADAARGRDPAELDLNPPTAFLLGSEGQGLPGAILAAATAQALIPMAAGVGSLNVHAAATVLLYESMRQRRHASPR